MNIISNNCIGASIYKQLGIEFSNPFIWSLISPEDMVFLINNYDEMDLTKISFVSSNKMVVDGKIRVLFPHHIKDPSYQEPTKIDSNIFFKNIEDYLLDSWNRRVLRLKNLNENPIFIISDRKNGNENGTYVFDNPNYLNDISTQYKIVLVGDEDFWKSPKCNNFDIVSGKNFSISPVGRLAEIIIERENLC